MQIVIDIPESMYEGIKLHRVLDTTVDRILYEVEYGVPLPKGHGRLIDADKIGLTDFECVMCNGDYKEALKMYIEKVEKTQVVLEADKGDS